MKATRFDRAAQATARWFRRRFGWELTPDQAMGLVGRSILWVGVVSAGLALVIGIWTRGVSAVLEHVVEILLFLTGLALGYTIPRPNDDESEDDNPDGADWWKAPAGS